MSLKRKRSHLRAIKADISDDSAVESDIGYEEDEEVLPKRMKYHKTTGKDFTDLPFCPSDRKWINLSNAQDGHRVLMRPWLEQQADSGRIPGLCWYNKERKEIRIPWKHGSRSGWTIDDCCVYLAWATHTGKVESSPEQPKKWKANFRCALNSLPDVKELSHLYQKRGNDPFKVYALLPSIHRRKNTTKKTKRCKRNIKEENKIKEEYDDMYDSHFGSEYRQSKRSPNNSFDKFHMTTQVKTELPNQFESEYKVLYSTNRPTALIPTVVEEISEENYDENSLDFEDLTYLDPVGLDNTASSPRSSGSSNDSGIFDSTDELTELDCASLEDLKSTVFYSDVDIDVQQITLPFSSCWELTEEGKNILFYSEFENIDCNFENSEFADFS